MGSLVVLTQLAPMNSLLSHFPASNNCAQQMTSASQASCLMHEALSFDPVHPRLCSHLLPAEGPRASSDLLRAGSGAGIPHVPPHRATAKPSSASCHVQSSLLNALGATTSALLQEPTCGTSPLGRKKRAWVSILTALMSLSRGAALALLTPSHSFTSLAYCGIFCPYKLLNSSQTARKQQQGSYIPRLLQCPKCDLKHSKLNGLHAHLL